MKVATFNANSVRTRLPIILEWLEHEKPEILCLQETKCRLRDFPAAAFEERGYHCAVRGQKAYNGVAILAKNPLEEIQQDLYQEDGEEARFVRGRIAGLPVVNVYVPQGQAVGTPKFSYKLRWLRDLLEHIRRNYRPDEPLILTGDFNVALDPTDVHDPEGFEGQICFHPDERALMRGFIEWGLVDLFRLHHPEGGNFTFWDYRIPNAFKRRMGWRIDYILATAPQASQCRRSWIDTAPRLMPKPSDHTFLVVEFENRATRLY